MPPWCTSQSPLHQGAARSAPPAPARHDAAVGNKVGSKVGNGERSDTPGGGDAARESRNTPRLHGEQRPHHNYRRPAAPGGCWTARKWGVKPDLRTLSRGTRYPLTTVPRGGRSEKICKHWGKKYTLVTRQNPGYLTNHIAVVVSDIHAHKRYLCIVEKPLSAVNPRWFLKCTLLPHLSERGFVGFLG